MEIRPLLYSISGWFFGMLLSFIGAVNTFWGNDGLFGLFIIALSLFFYPPFRRFLKKNTGFTIPPVILILLAAFLIWASLGVGELFEKINMMVTDLRKF